MFFDTRSFAEPKLTMENFREWASEIGRSYLNCGTLPTDSLCKIAQLEELTPHQIEVLAGEANKFIHTQKFASEKEKYFAAEFPLADAKTAIDRLQVTEEKVAFNIPEPKIAAPDFDVFAAFGVKPEIMDKTASLKREIKVASEKTELVAQRTKDEIVMNKFAEDTAEKRFIKEARQIVLDGGSSAQRMKTLCFLNHFIKQANMEFAKPTLAKLAYVLMNEGMLEPSHGKKAVGFFMSKTADEKAPQEMISEWLTSKVVNGDHPLYITLKTFKDARNALSISESRGQVVDDRLGNLQQKIRAL